MFFLFPHWLELFSVVIFVTGFSTRLSQGPEAVDSGGSKILRSKKIVSDDAATFDVADSAADAN
jgi:hypothetical protein